MATRSDPTTLQELYAAPDSWTQGLLARDRSGEGVRPDDPDAACWCLSGGIDRCYGLLTPESRRACDLIRGRVGPIIAWNNAPGRTIEEVRDLVRELNV